MVLGPERNKVVRLVVGLFCLALFLLILAGAWTLPFYYPSQSLFYKFGFQKLLLRTGKLVGITGGLLFLVQLVAVAPLPFFERVFTRAALLRLHRYNGLLLLLLLLHPVLILWADDFTFYTLEKKYLPEFVGVGLLCCLLPLILSAQFRTRLPIAYRTWRSWHRLGALVVIALFLVHLLTVSETFRTGLPHDLALGLAGLEVVLMALILGRALLFSKG